MGPEPCDGNDCDNLVSGVPVCPDILVGHSDGGSITLIYGGLPNVVSPDAVIVIAPHVFCEELSIKGIEAAKQAYEHQELKSRLEKFH